MKEGLRVSEILGLKWKDFDWEGLRLAVRQAYVFGQQDGPKTQTSQRWMPLDRLLAEKLRQHKKKFASFGNPEGWIFANPETGRPYWPGRIQENWLVPAAQKAGIGLFRRERKIKAIASAAVTVSAASSFLAFKDPLLRDPMRELQSFAHAPAGAATH